MNPVKFEGHNVIIAKNQPEYIPLPAHQAQDGISTFCWKLTWRERITMLLTGHLWHQVATFNRSLQPQLLSTVKPNLSRGERLDDV